MPFAPLFDRYPETLRPRSGPTPLGNAGGLSGAKIWRVETARGPMALRAWPREGPSRADLQQIHGWVREAGRLRFVPVPEIGRDGRSWQEFAGSLWEIAPWMPGKADLHEPSAVHVRSSLEGLATFHEILARHRRFGPSPGLRARYHEITAFLRSDFAPFHDILLHGGPSPARNLALRWLRLAREHAEEVAALLDRESRRVVALQPCLRDARPDHFLFEADTLTGLIDFGAMRIETEAADLARLLGGWFGGDRRRWSEALARYQNVRKLDPITVEMVPAFDRSTALLGGARWVRWIFVEGRTFDDPEAALRGFAAAVDRLGTP